VGPLKSAVSLQGKGTRKAATTSKTRNTNIRRAPLLLHSLTPSLLLLVYRPPSLFCSSTFSDPQEHWHWVPSLDFSPVGSYLPYLVTLSRISISTEKTPEAATIVPSAPTYARSLLSHLARSRAQAPLPSILEPRDLPRFHPFLSALRVFSVSSPHIPGNSGATALPTISHSSLFDTERPWSRGCSGRGGVRVMA